MSDLPKLELPAPWGLAVVMGLAPEIVSHRPLEPGQRVEVVQKKSTVDCQDALEILENQAIRLGYELMETVPWNCAMGSYSMGTVMVDQWEPEYGPGGAVGYVLTLSDPKPAWGGPPKISQPAPPAAAEEDRPGCDHKGSDFN